VTFGWNDNSNNENGFRIYKWGYGDNDWDFYYLGSVGANVTNYTDIGLQCDHGTWYRVTAYNNAHGESDPSPWEFFRTLDCPPDELFIYLPVVMKDYSGRGLYGQITDKGSPVSGSQVRLIIYDGSSYATFDYSTTDSNGNYLFSTFPVLETGQEYFVLWTNYKNSNQLSSWFCDSIYPDTTDPLAYICNFDVENIELLSPDSNSVISLPYTFLWQKRSITTEDYVLYLGDKIGRDPLWWTDQLGYSGSYILNSLPQGFISFQPYEWWVYIYGENGFGVSYSYNTVTFQERFGNRIVDKIYLNIDSKEYSRVKFTHTLFLLIVRRHLVYRFRACETK